jgi:hypothetical protein
MYSNQHTFEKKDNIGGGLFNPNASGKDALGKQFIKLHSIKIVWKLSNNQGHTLLISDTILEVVHI